MIPKSFIADLLDRVDIVDVISPHVPLKKKGINWFGLCPFHHEKTGSFSVNQQRQSYKCFGCGAHGNAIGFLMDLKGLSYPDAIRELASMVGLEVPEERGEKDRREKKESLTDLVAKAADYYVTQLRGSAQALSYLRERQVTDETRARFSLGYSPDRWQALEDVFGDAYGGKRLEDCGLVIAKDGGRRYDRFRGRLMFPIRDARGRHIGFGARIMGEGEPKYLNSPETEIFQKGKELYGFYEAKEAIRKSGRAIVCEGYMDVIQLSQAGFRESVAALGTAIGAAHVEKLFRATSLIYFSFDGDDAGRHAAWRALEQTLPVIKDGEEARFILLPPEHDPDSLIKAEGPAAFEREIANSLSLSSFLADTLAKGKDMGEPEGRTKFLTEAKPLLLSMKGAPILRRQIISSLQLIIRFTEAEISAILGISARSGRRGGEPYAGGRTGPISVTPYRYKLLQHFLAWPELIFEFSSEIEDNFLESGNESDRKIVEVWRACRNWAGDDAEKKPTDGVLIELLGDSPDFLLYEKLLDEESRVETPLEVARSEVRRAFIKIAIRKLVDQRSVISSARVLDEAKYRHLTDVIRKLEDEISSINSGTAGGK